MDSQLGETYIEDDVSDVATLEQQMRYFSTPTRSPFGVAVSFQDPSHNMPSAVGSEARELGLLFQSLPDSSSSSKLFTERFVMSDISNRSTLDPENDDTTEALNKLATISLSRKRPPSSPAPSLSSIAPCGQFSQTTAKEMPSTSWESQLSARATNPQNLITPIRAPAKRQSNRPTPASMRQQSNLLSAMMPPSVTLTRDVQIDRSKELSTLPISPLSCVESCQASAEVATECCASQETAAACFTKEGTCQSSESLKVEGQANTTEVADHHPKRTLVVYPSECLDHVTGEHQENPRRLAVLCGETGVLRSQRFAGLHWLPETEIPPVAISDVLRVHEHEYVEHLRQSCAKLPCKTADPAASYAKSTAEVKEVPAAQIHEEVFGMPSPLQNPTGTPTGYFDADTPLVRESYNIALRAAGAVCTAIDLVVSGEYRNAFVAIRPPGHHSGPNGAVAAPNFSRRPEMCSCGFCLLNNVAIGAAYAKSTYRRQYTSRSNLPVINRVAIIDFDIHHGNGTEEIIKNLSYRKQRLPLPSSWAPIELSSHKPWADENDADNVFFASVHLYNGDGLYPCSGSGVGEEQSNLHRNILNIPLDPIGSENLAIRAKATAAQRKELNRKASQQLRERVQNLLIPRLDEFKPDLVLLSSGFDGHADDFYHHFSEEDYGWLTSQLVGVAERHSQGRLVSVLEGGYSILPREKPVKPRQTRKKPSPTNGLPSRAFSDSLAHILHPPSIPGKDQPTTEHHDCSPNHPMYRFVYGGLARSCAEHVSALMSTQ